MANITDCDNTKQQRENTGFVEDPQPLSESLPSHRITQCQQESEESVEPEPGIWRRETEYTLLSATSGTSRTTITQASGPHPHISSLDSRLMKPVLSLRDTPRSQRSRDSEAEVERWRTAVSEQAENDADPLPGSGVHSRRPSENEIVLKQEERENQSTLPPESPPQFEHHPVLHNSSPRAPIPDDFRGIGSHLPHSTIPEDGSKNDGCLGHTQCEGDGAPPSPVDTLSGISCAGDGGTEVSLQVSSSIECLNSMTPITCVSRDVEDLIPTTIRLLQETCTHELPIRSRPADGNGYGGRTGNFDQASGTNWPERGNPSGHGCPPTQSSNAFPPSRMPRSPDDGEDGDDDDGDGDDDPNPSPSGGRASKPYLPCPFKVKYPSLACRDFPYMTRLR
ncbi:hypothetical protein EJ06DRAFT_9617 [Trichodelitschia bisporula]|uniref:Uncharacterized protein n=1 Tax=Trichodelitschia bisporula TaxID=703511 RepID=A0A6G1I9Z8_9PEZI|nr:hypothetical protein EJ06DRAFT_9617 [Trichodelitschia bisporula]